MTLLRSLQPCLFYLLLTGRLLIIKSLQLTRLFLAEQTILRNDHVIEIAVGTVYYMPFLIMIGQKRSSGQCVRRQLHRYGLPEGIAGIVQRRVGVSKDLKYPGCTQRTFGQTWMLFQ